MPVIRPLRPCDAELLGGGMLMGSDGEPEPYGGVKGVSLSVNCADGVEGERTFKALAGGGRVKMPKRGRGFGRGVVVGVVEFLS